MYQVARITQFKRNWCTLIRLCEKLLGRDSRKPVSLIIPRTILAQVGRHKSPVCRQPIRIAFLKVSRCPLGLNSTSICLLFVGLEGHPVHRESRECAPIESRSKPVNTARNSFRIPVEKIPLGSESLKRCDCVAVARARSTPRMTIRIERVHLFSVDDVRRLDRLLLDLNADNNHPSWMANEAPHRYIVYALYLSPKRNE